MTKNITIIYPYIPDDEEIHYVDSDNKFIVAAKKYAKDHSHDDVIPTGAVIVNEGKIIGYGSNGSEYHEKHGCERVRRGIPTGQGYELCEGCHPKNHSEPRAIKDVIKNHSEDVLTNSELYLWGHWWACESCWKAMIDAGIKKVYLEKHSQKLYNKEHPENIIGSQFN